MRSKKKAADKVEAKECRMFIFPGTGEGSGSRGEGRQQGRSGVAG